MKMGFVMVIVLILNLPTKIYNYNTNPTKEFNESSLMYDFRKTNKLKEFKHIYKSIKKELILQEKSGLEKIRIKEARKRIYKMSI